MKRKPAGTRREGRTLAVQLLFMLDYNRTPIDQALTAFFAVRRDDDQPLVLEEKPRAFCESLVRGVVGHQVEIDRRIKQTVDNFVLSRIGGIERAVLRLAVYEMVWCMETPPVVAINEALEISRRMAGDEAVRFVNGILDKIRSTLDRHPRIAELGHMEKQMARAARELGEAPEQPEEYSPPGGGSGQES